MCCECLFPYATIADNTASSSALLTGALAFEETMAHVVRLPLADLITVKADVTPTQVEQLVGGHRILPLPRPGR